MQERDIMHEIGDYWVYRDADCYTVFRAWLTHSTSDSAYPKTADGLSIAIARATYLANRMIPSTRGVATNA